MKPTPEQTAYQAGHVGTTKAIDAIAKSEGVRLLEVICDPDRPYGEMHTGDHVIKLRTNNEEMLVQITHGSFLSAEHFRHHAEHDVRMAIRDWKAKGTL